MVDDGLLTRFPKPDVILGQHVMKGPAGTIGWRSGVVTSAGDSLQVRLFGRGAHGSMPEASVDPVVMAAATVMRLQTIVSREVAANDAAVVTVGALQAGTKENVIPDEAILKLNVRTFDPDVRTRVLAAIERIVKAEAAASGAPRPPEITPLDRYALVTNDAAATTQVVDAFRRHFPADRLRETKPSSASEDFGTFGTEWQVPSVFWFVGGTDPERVREGQGGGPARRAADQPQPALRAGPAPDAGDGGGDAGGRRRGVADAERSRRDAVRTTCLMASFLVVLDLVGTFVFALSGAMAGIKHRLDLFGVLVLSFAAGNAGGIIRDVLLGATPPPAISDWRYIGVSLARGARHLLAGLRSSTGCAARCWCSTPPGSALFAVSGALKALAVRAQSRWRRCCSAC